MEGTLKKWTNLVKGWQYRWFVLDSKAGQLSYYTSKERALHGSRRGSINLRRANVQIEDNNSNSFNVTRKLTTWRLQASNREEFIRWVSALENVIFRFRPQIRYPCPPKCDALSPSDEALRKKLAESEMLLHILSEQINNLDIKAELNTDPGRKFIYSQLLTQSKKMLKEIKHTINRLQIAKYNMERVNSECDSNQSLYVATDMSRQSYTSQESGEDSENSASSNDEEDFFDAHDLQDCRTLLDYDFFHQGTNHFVNGSNRSPSSTKKSVTSSAKHNDDDGPVKIAGLKESENNVNGSPTTSLAVDPRITLDYDALYENSDEDMTTLESHGSVISHLLSQVKIGMDLTKVALPTYILEARSLLEMFADYFAHPDMFIGISEMSTERERLIQVVRWYLCSYHAGRKSSIAKKPYNPILGEIFQCHWDIPGVHSQSNQSTADGPIDWCNADQLVFVAEQVSHHPPISAFYAEHFNKQISFNAHVWTKSKFLGLSIGVQNIGHGVIKVLKYGEEYIVTFPNGYGRSILTVPWVELGGSVSVTCEKTGYRANLEFLTKPFYGGKKHRIYGELFGPREKDAFMTLAGEWNGEIQAKWQNGTTELFADVNTLKVTKKNVRPIEKQEDMESRKLWKEVTAGLKLKDIDHATNAKLMLEQKQRTEAEKRKELGLEWNPKVFRKLADDSWMYVKPLSDRIKNNKYEELNS